MPYFPKEIRTYTLSNGRTPYQACYDQLQDRQVKATVFHRLTCVEAGKFGDFKRLDTDLYALRIPYGTGVRIYFGTVQNSVVLLCGETEGTQQRDIRKAQNYWNDFKKRMEED